MNSKFEQDIVNALASAILDKKLYDTSFKTFKRYLHNTKQFNLKCILLDNRYLYNSILKKANFVCAERLSL